MKFIKDKVDDDDDMRMDFVNQYKIKYMLVYPETRVEPKFLSNWNLIVEDKQTEERFFELKKLK